MAEFDPELVEQAARALFEVSSYRIIPWGEVPEWLRAKYENDALAVLTAVAPTLMAQGANEVAQEFDRLHESDEPDPWYWSDAAHIAHEAVARIEKGGA